ncbi:hypothetical protein LTR36_000806 [Oleoguttula mirabilis]|uniref:Cleavage and polyadenylation specificity factor subunit 2 n=1 Tax=Oleoguttula mirabilis TaxID=1507867 RepID=A0AAV9J371_9PEZI|nr:hypothetical protein LTR36_000806 [Oleoguttula mirabilis]
MFTFTPLLGAQSASPASQSLLELDGGVKILVDVGWDEAFDAATLQALEQHVSTLSIVLLTHPTIDHLGAYAHCCKHIPLFAQIPVYATTPVVNLGRTLLADLYASSPLAASIIPTSTIASSPTSSASDSSPNLLLDPPTPDEIGSYFSLINPLKYSQPHQPIPSPFSPPLAGLTITAYGAGHTLGGTIWHIQHGLESIVYAADWNQGRENLFSGASWLSGGSEIIEPLRRPTALICSSKGVEKSSQLSRKKRDDTLISLIRETIAQGGKVLIPTDSSARVLELSFILNQTWRDNIDGPHADTYKNAHIYMASRSSTSSVRYLNSMLEWLDDAVRGEAEAAMTKGEAQGKGQGKAMNPLDWKYVKQIERQSQVERAMSRTRPCVMLASDSSMDWGFSRQALQTLAADPRNLVIMTEKVAKLDQMKSSVGRQLWDAFQDQPGHTSPQSGAKVVNGDGITLELREASTAGLNADETALYQTYMARQQQMHSTLQGDNTLADPTTAGITEEQQEEEEESSSEDEDEDVEHQGRALNLSAQLTQSSKRKVGLTDAELGVNVLLRAGKHVFDYDVRHKRGREKLFPFVAHRARTDDFGDLIKPEDYLRAEERDEIDGVDMRGDGAKHETAVGQKRKWDDAAFSAAANAKGRRNSKPQNKRQRQDKQQQQGRSKGHEPDDIDAAIARATGQKTGPGEKSGGGGANGTLAAQAESDSSSDADDDAESDYEPEDAVSEGPRKLVFTTRSLALKCRLAYVDFAGLHEKRDLQMIIPLIRPRKLILIAGGVGQETRGLAEECRRLLGGNGAAGGGASSSGSSGSEVFAPVVGEAVDASVDTNAWTLKLSRALVRRLVWQEVKGLGVVAITGRLGVEDVGVDQPAEETSSTSATSPDENAKKKLKLLLKSSGDEDTTDTAAPTSSSAKNLLAVQPPLSNTPAHAALPVLDLLTNTTSPTSSPSHHHHPTTPSVHVGDLRLAPLRALLAAGGHTCEFRGEGTLLVDGAVVVRKAAGGRIEVEADVRGLLPPGWATRDTAGIGGGGGEGNRGSFFAVRRAVYGGLAVVGGGLNLV